MDKQKEIEKISKMAITMGKCHFGTCIECKRQANSPHCFLFEQAVILHNAGYGNVKQTVSEFAGEVFKGLTDFLANKNITSANEVKQIIRQAEANCFGETL